MHVGTHVGGAVLLGGRGAMGVDGWHPDPYGIHEERLFAHGEPTPAVRDDGIGSFDAPPVHEIPSESTPLEGEPAPEWAAVPPDATVLDATFASVDAAPVFGQPGDEQTGHGTGGGRPTKPMFALAALLIAAGLLAGIFGIAGAGGSGSVTTTTENPLVQTFLHLPKATIPLIPPQPSAPTTTTNLAPLEEALRALPRVTVPSHA